MKKRILIIVAVTASLIASKQTVCGQNKQNVKIKDEWGKTHEFSVDKIGSVFQDYVTKKEKQAKHEGSHDISFETLMKLTTSYATRFNIEATQNNFGGFFPSADITSIAVPTQLDEKAGLLYFFCLDEGMPGNAADDRIFIAYIGINNFNVPYSDAYIGKIPDDSPFKISYNAFQCGANPVNEATMRTFMEGINFVSAGNPPLPIRYSQVKIWNQAFIRKFTNRCQYQIDPPPAPLRTFTCNDKAYGFFEKSELDKLINQGGALVAGVRFFLGLEESKNKERIRIALVGATINSNKIVSEGEFAFFLERSFP